MSIAEKLTTIAENQQKVYNAGYAAGQTAGGGGADPNLLNYLSANWSGNFNTMFYQAKFPDGYEIVLDIPNAPANISSMFRVTSGLRKLTFIVPTTKAYAADYFIFGSSSGSSSIEELVLPPGVKFSNFFCFAQNSRKLKTIEGAINLSESSSNKGCFQECLALEEVRFVEGTIKTTFYAKQSSNLSDDTIDSLVKGLGQADALQDLSLHTTVINKLTAEQITTIANKNWQVI